MNELSFSRTRIAPTPSGYLHIGNAMSFLLTASLAKKANAKLLLRIDDLDKERLRKEYVEDVFDTMRFLQIEWNEGPKNYADYEQTYSQVHRMKLYEDALEQLRDERLVFACQCSRAQLQNGIACHCREKELSLDAADVYWRLITDDALPFTIKTIDGNRINATLPYPMKSFIIRRKDGLPAYQLSSLIDDGYFGVDAIVRGEDLWDSTLAQQYLAMVMKKPFFAETVFYHHPLVMNENDESKLSKSAGDASVKHWRKMGKRREDVIRMIGEVSGWSIDMMNINE